MLTPQNLRSENMSCTFFNMRRRKAAKAKAEAAKVTEEVTEEKPKSKKK